MFHLWSKHRVTILFTFIFIGLMAIGPANLISHVLSNAGLLALDRSLVRYGVIDRTDNVDPDLMNAEQWLRTASELNAANQGAWRGLGFTAMAQGNEREAITAWQSANFALQDFVDFGEQLRGQGQLEAANRWYEYATITYPNSAVPWYYMGLAHEGMSQRDIAIADFQKALKQADGLSMAGSLNLHIGSILQDTEPADLVLALNYYDAALTSDRFVNGWERISTHYARGDVLRQLKRSPEALQEFKWVANAAPDHYWGHMWSGLLTWQVNNDAQEAEQYLKTASGLRPDIKWSYEWLGNLYRQTGRMTDAIEAYQHVLSLDPQDQVAKKFLLDYTHDVH